VLDIEIEAKICELVKKSLEDRQYAEEFTFKITEKTISIAWKRHFIDLKGYRCSIHSDEIRHIENEHPNDIEHICKIHYYLNKFKNIDRTTTKEAQTGKKIPCFTFTKQLKDRKVKIVKLNLSMKKVLSLKTLYEVV